jgi:hypothetical protein
MRWIVGHFVHSSLYVFVALFVFSCTGNDDGHDEPDASESDADVVEDVSDISEDLQDGSDAEFPTGEPCPSTCPLFGGGQIVGCDDCEDGFCASSVDTGTVCTIPCESSTDCEQIGSSSQCEMVGEKMECSYSEQ